MMSYDIHPKMVLRVPRFPVSKAGVSMDELLADPVFREALYIGSDSMTEELSRNGFQLSACSEKLKHSLMKYQKRMSYRPTPFGGFAGVAVLPWKVADKQGIALNDHCFQTLVTNKETDKPVIDGDGEPLYRANPLIYPYGTRYRLIQNDSKQSVYNISEIFGSDAVKRVMGIEHIIGHNALAALLEDEGIPGNELESCMAAMLDVQLLLRHQAVSRGFPSLLNPEHKIQPGSAYDSYCSVSASGGLAHDFCRQLHDGMYCLEKLSSAHESPSPLSAFKEHFDKLFDRREVQLLQALDPELGIDYDGLSGNTSPSSNLKHPATIPWSPVHELLLSKWTRSGREQQSEINIHEEELEALTNPPKNYPPGMSVLFSSLGNRLHIKAAGGAGSLNMIGRFTVLDPEILKLAKDLAAVEMARNPDVVFAEVSHIDNDQVASVTRRAMVYEYEIPFFESPSLHDERVISLNDLYISLADNRLVLRSGRLNKQVIPRFSCAYNYHNSTLPVFRFLCDLQHEGIAGNFNFSLVKLFPGLPAYPRLVYKDVILEAASWHFDAKQLAAFKTPDPGDQSAAFRAFAESTGLPDEFCYEVHDHRLHINRNVPQDIGLLLKSVPSSGRIVLREYFAGQESVVKDEAGNSYTHECVAFLTNKTTSYSAAPICPLPGKRSRIHQDKLFPFDDWLYLKIYLHPAGFTDLLVQYLQPFVFSNRAKGNISSWFFVSYFDEDYHLRIRFRQVEGRTTHLVNTYRKLEQALRNLPNVRKLELCTYFRETERYSGIGIQCAEELFHLSSEMVLFELCNPLIDDPAKATLFSAVRFLLIGCNSLNMGYPEMESFSGSMTGSLDKRQRVELDSEFRKGRPALTLFLDRYHEKSLTEIDYVEILRRAVTPLNPEEKFQTLRDLNHMHLNRLFLHDQQFHELKSYYFLLKISRCLTSY